MSYYKVGKQVNFQRKAIMHAIIEGWFWATLIVGFIIFVLTPA